MAQLLASSSETIMPKPESDDTVSQLYSVNNDVLDWVYNKFKNNLERNNLSGPSIQRLKSTLISLGIETNELERLISKILPDLVDKN